MCAVRGLAGALAEAAISSPSSPSGDEALTLQVTGPPAGVAVLSLTVNLPVTPMRLQKDVALAHRRWDLNTTANQILAVAQVHGAVHGLRNGSHSQGTPRNFCAVYQSCFPETLNRGAVPKRVMCVRNQQNRCPRMRLQEPLDTTLETLQLAMWPLVMVCTTPRWQLGPNKTVPVSLQLAQHARDLRAVQNIERHYVRATPASC